MQQPLFLSLMEGQRALKDRHGSSASFVLLLLDLLALILNAFYPPGSSHSTSSDKLL